jgi:hypothetical protein
MIRPEFWTDSKIVECSTNARLLFIGTWSFADDNGNMDLCAKQIKMQIFPGDTFCIEPLLNELIKQELLIPYEVGGHKYLNIKNFLRYQRIDKPTKTARPNYAESLKLVDYSMSVRHEEKRREEKRSNTCKSIPDAYTADFMQFWQVYPRRLGKQVAFESFLKVVAKFPPADVIQAATEYARQCARERKEENFILHPSTFLNKDRWKDYCFEEAK